MLKRSKVDSTFYTCCSCFYNFRENKSFLKDPLGVVFDESRRQKLKDKQTEKETEVTCFERNI